MPRLALVLPLIFGSGACALAYQVTWLREFRLLFGASTSASAAVLAIFIGGLGAGSWILGPRADRAVSPFRLYAKLEVGIALSAALTPLFLWGARSVYLGLGGSTTLGIAGASLVRLLLAALVLLPPTFLMGGTLPAAARALEETKSLRRTNTALLYSANTFGAVCGAFFANFVFLEALGNRATLWSAASLNLLIAGLAFALSKKKSRSPGRSLADKEREAKLQESRRESLPSGTELAPHDSRKLKGKTRRKLRPIPIPKRFVLLASATVGFAFFLMELVWYRVLAPLLGGTVFTMGLILSVALLGVALGGAAYASQSDKSRPSLLSLSWTCLIEAALLLLPFAIGDDIAIWAGLLQNLGHLGFWGQTFAWTAIASFVILPGAMVSGYQFPLIIALLGRGKKNLGSDAGQAYAFNTIGAVLGSLAGGFGFMPLLGARGCWIAVAVALMGIGLSSAWLHQRPPHRAKKLTGPLLASAMVLGLLLSPGPSALWRHGGIGVGRYLPANLASPNAIIDFENLHRRSLLWEKDGVESGVALVERQGMAFVVNGKIDGHATLDAPTQIMSGLIGALLHPNPKTSLVIGLGTGSTAGWLGKVPSMERVDVSELEPAILKVARDCHAVNQEVLDNPKVNIIIGDGRELLLTSDEKYDLIFSEPSNPYRAGIASFFTHDFYQAIQSRLAEGGVFMQWMQAYEIEPSTIELVYATLGATFPYVETWRTHRDLLLLATLHPPLRTASLLSQRIGEEPYKSSLREAWQVNDLPGLLAYYVANPAFAVALNKTHRSPLNTDDRNLLEFGFARSIGHSKLFSLEEALSLSSERGQDHPPDLFKSVDWNQVQLARKRLYGKMPRGSSALRNTAGKDTESLAALLSRARLPLSGGAQAAKLLAEKLWPSSPEEAKIVLALQAMKEKKSDEALKLLNEVFLQHRIDPWIHRPMARRALRTLVKLAAEDPEKKSRIIKLLSQPFAAHALSDSRYDALIDITMAGTPGPPCIEAFAPFEPFVKWKRPFLKKRVDCYEANHHPLTERALRDLELFAKMSSTPFGAALKAQN